MADEKPADDVAAKAQDDAVLAALKDEGEQDTSKDSSPEDKKPEKDSDKKPEVAKDAKEEAKPKEDAKPEAPTEPADKESKEEPEAKADGEADADKTAEEDKPQGKAEERKAQLNTEIRDLVSKRNALKAEVEKINADVYQVATEDELVEQGLSATDAKVEALRQRIEVRDYNEKVAEAQLTIESESQRVLQDFPIFNPDSTDFDKELAEEAAQLLSANLVLDPNTQQVIGSNVSPYQLYKTIARAHQTSTVKGQIRGREDTEQMLANADSASNAAPEKKAKDPILEILASDDY